MSEINKKENKIASAIYLITSFFSDLEPLKWKLRSVSTDLVSEYVKDKHSVIREIDSLFAVAKNAGLISDTNYTILTQELSKLNQELANNSNIVFLQEKNTIEQFLPESKSLNYIKDKILPAGSSDRLALKDYGAVSVKKNTRQSIIIAILKRKKEIMIKDVTPLISGCGEKTIQRELLTMVQTGVLKKIGEKRWSRYTLA